MKLENVLGEVTRTQKDKVMGSLLSVIPSTQSVSVVHTLE